MPFGQPGSHVLGILLDDTLTFRQHPARIENRLMQLSEQIRILIRLAADHRAVERLQMRLYIFDRADAAVHHERQLWELPAQRTNDVVLERRDLTILFRAEAF